MKLKLVALTMSVLGLVSTSAFAADAPAKHKHHHVRKHHHHHHHMQAMAAQTDAGYKGALPVVVENCPTSQYATILDTMDQNLGRARPTEDCNKLIAFAGGANFDVHFGNRSTNYQGKNLERFSLNDAYLNIFGNVNDWAKAFASLSYGDPSGVPTNAIKTGGQYSNVYTNVTQNKVTLEQGFVRIANFDQYPVFIQLGKQFADFGRYMIHPITRSVTQSLSETLRTSAELGFIVPMGFHGDVYVFDNPITKTGDTHTKTNWGFALGFDNTSDQLGYGVNVGYLYNITGVNDVASLYTAATQVATNTTYATRVSALAVDGMVKSGPFSLVADYAGALSRLSTADGLLSAANGTRGARPWGGNVQAGYAFNAWSRNQNVYVGFQFTGDAVMFNLPKNRWTVGWNADMWKNTNLGVEIGRDHDYSVAAGGTGRNSGTVGLRAAVQFG